MVCDRLEGMKFLKNNVGLDGTDQQVDSYRAVPSDSTHQSGLPRWQPAWSFPTECWA